MGRQRTFSAEDWRAAQDRWGDFSEAWREVRHRAAMRGILYPPNGSPLDSWDVDRPSQRAMVSRAMRNSPDDLLRIIDRSRSWTEVIAGLLRLWDGWRDEAQRELRQAVLDRADEPSRDEAAQSLREILERVRDA